MPPVEHYDLSYSRYSAKKRQPKLSLGAKSISFLDTSKAEIALLEKRCLPHRTF